MIYTIEKYSYKALVNTGGAYIERLDYNGKNIIYPKTIININGKEKTRGGMHVCLPQFSNGDRKNLELHGFGRDCNWKVEENKKDSIILSLDNDVFDKYKEYESMSSSIEYKITENGFKTTLLVRNNGDKEIEICPAFHPYFCISDKNIYVNDEKIDTSDEKYTDTDYKKGVRKIRTDIYELELENNNLNVFALWSDFADDYFCVEPTYNSVAFRDGVGTISLGRKEQREFSYSIRVI